jgi:uncharacterized membrane protein
MKIWTYISTFLAGVVAGLLIFLKLKDPETEIVNNDNQRIGKVKQRGETVSGMIEKNREAETLSSMETRKEERKRKRAARGKKREGENT